MRRPRRQHPDAPTVEPRHAYLTLGFPASLRTGEVGVGVEHVHDPRVRVLVQAFK